MLRLDCIVKLDQAYLTDSLLANFLVGENPFHDKLKIRSINTCILFEVNKFFGETLQKSTFTTPPPHTHTHTYTF